MNPLEKILARMAELKPRIEALGNADELNDEERTEWSAVTDEWRQLEAAKADHEERQAMVERAATVQFRKPTPGLGDNPADIDLRSASAGEVRSAALRTIERARHAKDEYRDAAARLVEQDFAYVDPDAAARYVVATERPEYRSAFFKYLRHGAESVLHMSDAERSAVAEVRAMGVTTDASGGYSVPVTIDPTILITTGTGLVGILPYCRIEPVFTDAWRGVSAAAAAWSFDGELTEVSDDALTQAQPTVSVHQTQAFVPYSIQYGEDVPNAAAELQRAAVAGYYDQMASAVMVGTGSAQPWGIFATTVTTVDVTTDNTFGAPDLDKVWAALPELRRANATWVMNVDVENDIRNFGSGSATSRFTVNQTAEGINILNGHPVVLSDYAPTWTGSDAASILVVGDFREFLVAQRIGMSVEYIPHVFSGTNGRPIGARGLYARARWGSDVTMVGAFRRLKNQTS
jgi:HK97 family phage major capsid protein